MKDTIMRDNRAIRLFAGLGIIGIVGGGIVSAFGAHHPTEFAMWASAYLVLVVGVAQVGFALALRYVVKQVVATMALLAFVMYNLANIGVLLGTYLKDATPASVWMVDGGGILLSVALLCLLWATRNAPRSSALFAFYGVIMILLVSMPIGLLLAHR